MKRLKKSSVFIGSNVIVRYFAGDLEAKKLLGPVIDGGVKGFINEIVFSEVIFLTIRLVTCRGAHELKRKPELVKEALKNIKDKVSFINTYFNEVEVDEAVKEYALKVMEDHGRLPNDALIAATCRHHGLEVIATFDEDFKRIPWLKTIP